jgi:hypothetical protein
MDVEVVVVVTLREEGAENKTAERAIKFGVDDPSKAVATLGMKALAQIVKKLER